MVRRWGRYWSLRMMENENEGKFEKEIKGKAINISKGQAGVEFLHSKIENDAKDELVLEKWYILSIKGEAIEITTKELKPNRAEIHIHVRNSEK